MSCAKSCPPIGAASNPGLKLGAGTEVDGIHGSSRAEVVAGTGAYADLVELAVKYVAPVGRIAHPGVEHTIWSSVVSDVLSAVGPVIAIVPDAHACAFVRPLGEVREVIALDHVLRMSTGGSLEGWMHAERLQAVLFTGVIVQGKQPNLLGVASTRRISGRVNGAKTGDRKEDGDENHQQVPHEYIPPSLFQLVSTSAFQLFAVGRHPRTKDYMSVFVPPQARACSRPCARTSSSAIRGPCCRMRPWRWFARARTEYGRWRETSPAWRRAMKPSPFRSSSRP